MDSPHSFSSSSFDSANTPLSSRSETSISTQGSQLGSPAGKANTFGSASRRVENFFGHSLHFVESLKKQNTAGDETQIAHIYKHAKEEIVRLKDGIQKKYTNQDEAVAFSIGKTKGKKASLKLDAELRKSSKKVIAIIKKAQLDVLAELAHQKASQEDATSTSSSSKSSPLNAETLKRRVKVLAQAGKLKRGLYHLLAKVFISYARALENYQAALVEMKLSTRKQFSADKSGLITDADVAQIAVNQEGGLNSIERDKLDALLGLHPDTAKEAMHREATARRAGVVGIGAVYRIAVTFQDHELQKQLESMEAQFLSDQKREVIEKEITLPQDKKTTSRMVPLNRHFDREVSQTGLEIKTFQAIAGEKGISSLNRQEGHLINGWASKLISGGEVLLRTLRHGITSDKFEKNPEIRKKNSLRAAKELVEAALLQEIAELGLTQDELKEKASNNEPIVFNFNSVSLVTPDDIRALHSRIAGHRGADEKTMLADQVKVLQELSGKTRTIKIGEIEVPYQVNANTFNFGVNAGAVGKILGVKVGLEEQYKYNMQAWKKLEKQYQDYSTVTLIKTKGEQKRYTPHLNAAKLKKDITIMMQDKQAYLKGGNQYEIGAKILLLSNFMDKEIKERIRAIKTNGTVKTLDNNQILALRGVQCAINCMSGKDRTGVMDCMAKAMALWMEIEKTPPLHFEMATDKKAQKKFCAILVPLLLESGNLEITELNTGARGYKVQEEAQLFGMSLENFLAVQGMSGTTAG